MVEFDAALLKTLFVHILILPLYAWLNIHRDDSTEIHYAQIT